MTCTVSKLIRVHAIIRPSPRQLSEAFMKGSDGHGSVRNRTAMLAFFGQVLAASFQYKPLLIDVILIAGCHI